MTEKIDVNLFNRGKNYHLKAVNILYQEKYITLNPFGTFLNAVSIVCALEY